MCGIKDIMIISTPVDIPHFQRLLGDGSSLGLNLNFKVQEKPEGIAQAYLLAEDFINNDHSMMILGDNLFYGDFGCFRNAVEKQQNKLDSFDARIFAYPVRDPERFGVVEFDPSSKKVLSLEEKPSKPKSHFAVPGVYIYDGSVCDRVKNQEPSERGELEITDLNLNYLQEGKLSCEIIGRGMAWLDTGTPESLNEANNLVSIIEQRQGHKVACVEEIALRQGFIDINEFEKILSSIPKGHYHNYLTLVKKEFDELSIRRAA